MSNNPQCIHHLGHYAEPTIITTRQFLEEWTGQAITQEQADKFEQDEEDRAYFDAINKELFGE